MSNYRREPLAGGTYFFTLVTYRRQPLLTHPDVRAALRDAISTVRQTLPFTIDAWVLLPDHLHCVWTLPEGDNNFSARWSIIKRLTSQQCRHLLNERDTPSASRNERREFLFWQRRFWEHIIRDEADYIRCVDYIHWNPVKHGHSSEASSWPYSTFGRYVTKDIYPADWGGSVHGNSTTDFGEPL